MKRLLIVVDYQKDFVDGSLGFDGAEKLDARIAEKIASYRATGDEVAFTFDTHHRDYLKTQEGRNLPIEHCVDGTPGHDLYGEVALMMRDSDTVFKKPSFGSVELFERLRELIGAGSGLESAADTLHPGNGFPGVHPHNQAGNALQVAVAPPLDLNFFYNPVFDLHPHELRADAAGPEYVLHKSFLPRKSAKVVMSI